MSRQHRPGDWIDAEARRLVEEQYQRATEVLEANQNALEHLVALLLEKETLQGAELEEALSPVEDQTGESGELPAAAAPPQAGPSVGVQPAS